MGLVTEAEAMSNKKLKFKLTFEQTQIESDKVDVSWAVCKEFPELAIMSRKERFIWKHHYIARLNDVEHEMPTLRDALVLILQQKGIPAEAVTQELMKYVEEAVN